MSHTLTLAEDTKEHVYRNLRNRPAEAFGVHTSSRWLNKELKFLFCTLHQSLFQKVLEEIQKNLQASNKKQTWATAFTGLLSLGMTVGSIQVLIRCKEETDKRDQVISLENEKANSELKEINVKWNFLKDLFHKKYLTAEISKTKGFNPVHQDRARKVLDMPSQALAQQIKIFPDKHREQSPEASCPIRIGALTRAPGAFLDSRRSGRSPTTCRDPDTSSLVADFLLSFDPQL